MFWRDRHQQQFPLGTKVLVGAISFPLPQARQTLKIASTNTVCPTLAFPLWTCPIQPNSRGRHPFKVPLALGMGEDRPIPACLEFLQLNITDSCAGSKPCSLMCLQLWQRG